MKNFENYCLEFEKLVNNLDNKKLNLNFNHIISKKEFEKLYLNYNLDEVEYIGFDLDSLNSYENWLGENIGRN